MLKKIRIKLSFPLDKLKNIYYYKNSYKLLKKTYENVY